MPKSPKTKTAKPKPESLKLNVIDPDGFTSREAVRSFVRSDRFSALSGAVGYAASPCSDDDGSRPIREIENEGREVAAALADDLAALAWIAAGSGDAPTAAGYSNLFSPQARLLGVLQLGRALAAASDCHEAADAVLLLGANAAWDLTPAGRAAREDA